jgi:hypothetical protein
MKAADGLARSVREWLEALDPGQRERATFRFDDPERFVWAYTPGDRAGLALADMGAGQREAAMRVVSVAMSERGASEVGTIIELESILGALERERGRAGWIRRDPERYWFAVFGDPATGAPWSWRVGGHHVSRGRLHAIVPRREPGRGAEGPDRRCACADGRGDDRPDAACEPVA